MNSITQNFRSKLFAGVAAALPLFLTYVLLEFLFITMDEMSAPILDKFGIEIPGLGILLTLALIFFLGVLVTNFLGRKIFDLGEKAQCNKYVMRQSGNGTY